MPDKKEIVFEFCTVRYDEPVIYLYFKENAELDVKEIRQLIKASEKLAKNAPYLLFSDARVHLNISSEARKVSADQKEAPLLIANAALINNLALTMTANFFSRFNKPHFKFKAFNNEKKALKWLLQFAPHKK